MTADYGNVSTHSRPKAAGYISSRERRYKRRFNTQPPEGGWLIWLGGLAGVFKFQHTAARRRLALRRVFRFQISSFNTQPPEGGWLILCNQIHLVA